MAISYNKLWKLMIDQNMNKTQLKDASGISTNAIAKICKVLNCNIGDIVDYNIDEIR